MRTTSNILSHFRDLRKKRKAAAAVLTVLSLMVAAGVFWQLRLTGISMTADPQCGYEVHAHSEGCSQVPVLNCNGEALALHVHTDACRGEAGELVCGQMDILLHTHDSRCLDADGTLVCTLAEYAPHQHEEGCYTPTTVVVDPGHQHGEGCYSYIKSELTICGLEETPGHAHTDACVTAETYGCGQEASDTHQHTEECGKQIGCGIPVAEGHTHSDACYPDVQNELICQEEVRDPVTQAGEPELTCTRQVLQLHEHTDGCYTEGALTCGLMELKSHQHSDACFRLETREGLCQIPEHTHSDSCYPDLKADVETAEDWEKDLPALQEDRWADNLILIAQSQLGYTQSQRNFMAGKPGQPNFYTRYGQWAEEPYGDWRGQYISFCLHYAGIPQEAIPYGAAVADWAEQLKEFMVEPEKMAPQLGDVIFFDNDGDETPDAVGILAEALPEEDADPEAQEETKLVTLQGNVAGAVAEVEYDSEKALSFLSLADARVRYEQWLAEHPEVPEPTDPTETTAATDPTGETTEPTASTETATEPTEFVPIPEQRTFTKVHQGSDYTLTVTYGEEAGLGEEAQLQVEEILPGSKEYEEYYARVKQALAADNLIYTRLFDVTFLVDGREKEPSASVNVAIQYHEALVTDTDQETTAQVVHFAENGTEVLPAQIQQDERGITEISHVQDSFSIMAFTIIPENQDNGDRELLVDWYVFLDKKWTKVGSTRTGRRVSAVEGGYPYLTEGQALHILSPYGFAGGENGWKELTYRRIETYGEDPVMKEGIWTTVGQVDSDDQVTYHLVNGGDYAAYCIYYAPTSKGDFFKDTGTENDLYTKMGDDLAVYSVKVYDPNNQDYGVEENRPSAYVVHGKSVSVVIPKGTADDPWALFTSRLDYLGELPGSLGERADIEGDALNETMTVKSVTQPLYIARKSIKDTAQVDTTQAPDNLLVNYYVYLDKTWQRVGTTYKGWTIDGRTAAGGEGPYRDVNGNVHDVISFEQVVEVLGKYGFSPAVPDDESSAVTDANGPIAGRTPVRITNLGHQSLGSDKHYEYPAILFDSCYDYRTTLFFPLGQSIPDGEAYDPPKTPPGGYNVYFVPGGTTELQSLVNMGTSDASLKKQAAITKKAVNYHVYVDGAWTKVASSQYLIPGSTTVSDKIGVEQIRQALEPYGFPQSGSLSDTELFYAPVGGTIAAGALDGTWYQLGLPADSADGYNIYWLPGNTEDYSGVDTIPITSANIGGTFHLLTVLDPSRYVYESQEMMPRQYVRHNTTGTLTVKIPTDTGKGDWILKGLDRNKILVGPDGFEPTAESNVCTAGDGTYTRTQNTDGTYTFTISPMTETVIISFPFANGDRSLSNNLANADNADALAAAVSDPNITFTMHNYSTRINELLKKKGLVSYGDGDLIVDSATGHTLWPQTAEDVEKTSFAFSGAGGIGASSNPARDNVDFLPGHSTVEKNLSGYPTLSSGKDLDFLWGGGSDETDSLGNPYVIDYMNVENTPLQIVNGQYRYYSYFNAVDFNTEESKFYLRPYVERTEETAVKHLGVDDYGDFLPFNHSGGERISDRPYNFYQEDVDYWFGLTMNTRFYMTENGTVNNGDPMIFAFSGGDDTYVYIDDKLVLDMGGTHGAVTGTINFQTGLIQTYYDFDGISALPQSKGGLENDPEKRYYTTTLYEAYKAALAENNLLGTMAEAQLANIFDKVEGETVTGANGVVYPVYRLKSYTTHELSMFYLDRDSGVANFNLQFNMPTLPEADLTISLDTNYGIPQASTDDHQFYSNSETHQFRIVDKKGVPLNGSRGAQYDVQNQDGSYDTTVKADSNGIFRMKSGQRVVVDDIMGWVTAQGLGEYTVQELVPVQDIHKDMAVLANGEPLTRKTVTIGEGEYYAYSQKVKVNLRNPAAAFTPFVNVRNLNDVGYLRVGVDTNSYCEYQKIFPIKVTINGQLVPDQTKFYLVKDGVVSETEYVRANDKGEITIGPGTVYQMGAKLMAQTPDFAGYQYSVAEQNAPKGWALDYYLKRRENVSTLAVDIEPLEDSDSKIYSGPVTGTIEEGYVDTVLAVNKVAPISVGIEMTVQFTGLDLGDQVQRTAVYEIEQVERKDCTQCEGKSVFLEWSGDTVPVDLNTYSGKRITAIGSAAKKDSIQIAYTDQEGLFEGKYFYYRIRQTDIIDFPYGESFIADQTEYVVKVTIGKDDDRLIASVTARYNQDGFLISGSDCGTEILNGPSALSFVNHRTGYRLPASGGPGTISYILSGTGCMGLALLMYNHSHSRKKSRSNRTRGQSRS